MNKIKTIIYLSLPVLLAAVISGGCSRGKAETSPGEGNQRAVRLANVEVETVHLTDLEEYLTLTGFTQADHDIIIASEQGGTVQELLADRGDRVGKGRVLARVSADIYEAQLAEAEANLRLKQAGLKKAKALFERRSITAMQRLQAQVEHDAAAAHVKLAESRLDRAVIKAPFAGRIEDRFIDKGEMVSVGGRLFRLADSRRMKIKSELAESDILTFHRDASGSGQDLSKAGGKITAQVHFDALPDRVFDAELTFVAASSDLKSGTFPCEFELDNPRGLLKAGMHARIHTLKNTHHGVIVLPQTALVESEKGRNVFVLESETARQKPVTLGASNRGMVVIESGLEAGETVIVIGQRDLVHGQKVRVTSRK
ncbi:MAG: efflux RND transporter periplasmic adaptor subunit, partial [Gemmatimonadota bacterium]|nr:efflux RND transporter periplasmic adaptor subunit [Gemmatimonadota bacterium]